MRIDIDFVAGSHGNYLAFILNKLLLGDLIEQEDPFDQYGSSHNTRSFSGIKKCFNGHFFQTGGTENINVISIKFTEDDLLPLTSISLIRAGNLEIYDKDLHVDTFNKLNNKHYRTTLENILSSYSDLSGYNDIKAEDWPSISTTEEFHDLPEWIKTECREIFGFCPQKIDSSNPNIARSKLREFFKVGFKIPKNHGFIQELSKMTYSPDQRVYDFQYADFYDTDKFLNQLENIRIFFNLKYCDVDVISIHNKFLDRQPFKCIKQDTNRLLEEIYNGGTNNLLTITLFQESYINAKIELKYNIEMPAAQEKYFLTTKEIFNHINEIPIRH